MRHLKGHFNEQARQEAQIKKQTQMLVTDRCVQSNVTIDHWNLLVFYTLFIFISSFDLRLDHKDPLEKQLDTALKLIERFMKKSDSTKTFNYYKPHMRKMLESWVDNGTITSVYSIWSSNDPDMVPMCHNYIDTIKADSTKLHGIWAYQWVSVTIDDSLGLQIKIWI